MAKFFKGKVNTSKLARDIAKPISNLVLKAKQAYGESKFGAAKTFTENLYTDACSSCKKIISKYGMRGNLIAMKEKLCPSCLSLYNIHLKEYIATRKAAGGK